MLSLFYVDNQMVFKRINFYIYSFCKIIDYLPIFQVVLKNGSKNWFSKVVKITTSNASLRQQFILFGIFSPFQINPTSSKSLISQFTFLYISLVTGTYVSDISLYKSLSCYLFVYPVTDISIAPTNAKLGIVTGQT